MHWLQKGCQPPASPRGFSSEAASPPPPHHGGGTTNGLDVTPPPSYLSKLGGGGSCGGGGRLGGVGGEFGRGGGGFSQGRIQGPGPAAPPGPLPKPCSDGRRGQRYSSLSPATAATHSRHTRREIANICANKQVHETCWSEDNGGAEGTMDRQQPFIGRRAWPGYISCSRFVICVP